MKIQNSAAIAGLIVLGLQITAVLGQNFEVVKTNVDVAVVVNSKNPVSNLTMPALRKLFAGETRTWPGGATVKLIYSRAGRT